MDAYDTRRDSVPSESRLKRRCCVYMLGEVESMSIIDTVADVMADALVNALANTVAERHAETLIKRLVKIKVKVLVDAPLTR